MKPTYTATGKPHQLSRGRLPHNNEQGFVLILCMVMLAVLTILGLMVLTSTDTELSITTNTRMTAEALSAAITAQEFAQTKILEERSGRTLANEDVAALLPPDTSLRAGGINEIDAYSGPASAKMRARFSADASSKGNIFFTTGEGSGGNILPYYRSTIETQRQRATARLEAVQVDLTAF